MNELNLYKTKNNSIKQNIQIGGNINKHDTFQLNHDHNKQENGLSAERLYRKRVLEQQQYIKKLEDKIKYLESKNNL